MLSPVMRRLAAAACAVALLCTALTGQAATDRLAPVGDVAGTGQTLGRAGFAYLTGLRTFAAAVVWNRLEEQLHEYYGRVALKDQLYLLPNLRLVVLLDPQFVQAYYETPWILASNGRTADARQVAEEGIRNNPRSGVLRAAYAQVLYLKLKDIKGAVAQANAAVEPDMQWISDSEHWDSLRIIEDIYLKAGETARAARVTAALDQLAAIYGGADKLGVSHDSGNHDHNGDGKADH